MNFQLNYVEEVMDTPDSSTLIKSRYMHVSDPELCLWHAVVCVVMTPPSLGMLLVSVSSLGGLPILSLPLNMATGILYLSVLL